jgi:hypothetical protein
MTKSGGAFDVNKFTVGYAGALNCSDTHHGV